MVPIPDGMSSLYLPPLDRCLTGGHRLLSWRAAFEALSDPDANNLGQSLPWFLADDRSFAALRQCIDPFSAPTNESKVELETRTSAINVTPGGNPAYDIKEIKADVAWLSQQAKIDEISALRIAILEWQERPCLRLLANYTEEESISLRQVIGQADLAASIATLQPTLSDAQTLNVFNSDEKRRARLLRLVLSERQNILAVKVLLESTTNQRHFKCPEGAPRINDLSTKLIEESGSDKSFTLRAITAFRALLSFVQTGTGWILPVDEVATEVEEDFVRGANVELLRVLQLVLTHIRGSSPTPDSVVAWFDFVAEYEFFEVVPTSLQESHTSLQVLISLVSLEMLRLQDTIEFLHASSNARETQKMYIFDLSCQASINRALFDAALYNKAVASPAIFAWSMILQTLRVLDHPTDVDLLPDDDISRSTTLAARVAPQEFQIALDSVQNFVQDEDPIQFLAKRAVNDLRVFSVVSQLSGLLSATFDAVIGNGHIFLARSALMTLISHSLATNSVVYSVEVMDAILTLLKGDVSYHDLVNNQISGAEKGLVRVFLDDDVMMHLVFDQSRARFPYEIAPYLNLVKTLGLIDHSAKAGLSGSSWVLGKLNTYTDILAVDFTDYELVREDENLNYSCIQLTADLPILTNHRRSAPMPTPNSSTRLAITKTTQDSDTVHVPCGTQGIVIVDTKPHVIRWAYEYWSPKLLANLLSTASTSSGRTLFNSNDTIPLDVQSDIISTLAVHLLACEGENAMNFLEDTSDGLNRNDDIITIVSDVFSQTLSRLATSRSSETSDMLVSCITFFHSTLIVFPSRVWPLLAQSELLEMDGRGGLISKVISSTEVPLGDFSFVLACVSLFNALMTDVVSRGAMRKSPTSSKTQRFVSRVDTQSGLTQKAMSKVLQAFVKVFVDVLQSLPEWRFKDPCQKLDINTGIISTLRRLIAYAYEFDDGRVVESKLTESLTAAAEYVTQSFLSPGANTLVTRPLTAVITTTLGMRKETAFSRAQRSIVIQSRTTFEFYLMLLRISEKLDTPASFLEKELFKALPFFCRLFVQEQYHKASIINLLTTLVKIANRGTIEPPSLFGQLGADAAKSFLTCLSDLSKPLAVPSLEVALWRFMGSVISSRQRWFANFILIGTTPRDTMKPSTEMTVNDKKKAIYEVALERLSKRESFSSLRGTAMLELVTLTQNHWPWMATSLARHREVLDRMANYLGDFKDSANTSRPEETVEYARQTRSAAIIARFFALYLYNSRQKGDTSIVKVLAASVAAGTLEDKGVAEPQYNYSLHQNLERNLESKFPSCSLSMFKRNLGHSEFGTDFFYDLEYATQVLSGRPSISGLVKDLAIANCNLSLVESQVELASSWKLLAVELSASISKDTSIHKQMAYIVHKCLHGNKNISSTRVIFGNLAQTRTSLAALILQRLVHARSEVPNIRTLFDVVWEIIRDHVDSFDSVLFGENADYYRSLLKILLLVLHSYSYIKPSPTDASTSAKRSETIEKEWHVDRDEKVLDILTNVVATGFKSLSAQLHEEADVPSPSDFALLTAILHAILQLPRAAMLQSQITVRLCDSNVSRYAIALFSWADKLTATDDDPIFGELSILFLFELSNLQAMTTFFATESLLSQLGSANLMRYFSEGSGIGPFERPQRLYSLWSNGILPLCLNILIGVGESIAPEIVAFLNTFSPQLERGITALDSKPSSSIQNLAAENISLSCASEAHTLALISIALENYRLASSNAAADMIPPLQWDKSAVKDHLESWLHGSLSFLMERVVATTQKETDLFGAKPNGDVSETCTNRLQELVLIEMQGALKCLESLA